MADADKNPNRYNYFYIHNVFGHFVKDTMDYFADYLYPRFSGWKIIGTYDKAVEWFNKTGQYNRELDQPMRPGLILDPSGDFAMDETYGKMPWRYPNLAPGFLSYVFKPIYQDENMLITCGFGRIVGELNFIALMSSFYEYTDMKVYLNLIFGGMERPIYPRWFNSFIVLPQELYDYQYTNDVTGESYKLNLEESYNELVKTTNREEVVFPCKILPRYKLTGMSDASTRLGGTDNMPDWKLAFTLQYEVEIPTYIVLESDYLAKKLNINIRYGSCYSENHAYTNNTPPVNEMTVESDVNLGLDSTSNSTVIIPSEATITELKSKVFRTRYYHVVTKSEADSTTVIDITIPESISDHNLLVLNGKYGELTYWDHYKIINETILRIDKQYVELEENDILEIYIYSYVEIV